MAKQLFANNASALLAASISDTDLTIQVATGYGALYPNPGAGEYFVVALENADGDIEFCKIESRTTDLLQIATGGRGFDGTVAQSWTNGQTRVELRASKYTLEQFIQRQGDVMSGNLDMDNNNVIDAHLTGDWRGTGGQLVGTPLRGTLDDNTNEVAVPSDGTRATAGGQRIMVQSDTTVIRAAAFSVGMIMEWFGAAIDVPTGWKICDGTGGTPDMRDRFVVGAGSTYALGATGGATSATSTAAGDHTHTGTVGDHVLTVEEMPSHHHRFWNSVGTQPGGSGRHYDLIGASYTDVDGVSSHQIIEDTGGDGAHSHDLSGISTAPTHTHDVATLPPYKALYFIMFTG